MTWRPSSTPTAGSGAPPDPVNACLSFAYWSIGYRIREDVLHEKRAEYGEEIVPTLSARLTAEYGRGFAEKGLRRMIQFAERFPDEQIVATLSRQLGWSHFVEIIPLDDPLKRDFYAEMCRLERWSVRKLWKKIDEMLFERTTLLKKPDHLIRRELDAVRDEDKLTPDLVLAASRSAPDAQGTEEQSTPSAPPHLGRPIWHAKVAGTGQAYLMGEGDVGERGSGVS